MTAPWRTAAALLCASSLLLAPRCSAFTTPRIQPAILTGLAESSNSNEGGDQDNHPMQPFFEETALSGADAVKKMSVEERTRRAMLAEAVEDRMCDQYDALEEILGEDGVLPESEEEREELTQIAKNIKVLQNDYQLLVTGEDSQYLNGFDFEK